MSKDEYVLYNKIYNNLIERKVCSGKMNEPDRYEREDAFMGAINDIENGKEPYEAFKESFELVHNIDLSEMLYKSAYNICNRF